MLHKLNSFLKESFALYFVNKVRVFILGKKEYKGGEGNIPVTIQ
jgi:hypothetical protein